MACVEFPEFVGEFAGGVIDAEDELGVVVAGLPGFAFGVGFGVGAPAFAELEALGLGVLEEAAFAADSPGAVPAATGTQGPPFALGTAPGWPLGGIEEFGCVPVCGFELCGVVCVSLPAALVVIGVGGPIVVICGVAGVVGAVAAAGGGALGVAVCPAVLGGGAVGFALLCARTQLLHVRRIAIIEIRIDTNTSKKDCTGNLMLWDGHSFSSAAVSKDAGFEVR